MQKPIFAVLKTRKLDFEVKAWPLQVCCAPTALLCGLSDWCHCNMHSFNSTSELVKLRKVYCPGNCSLSHTHFRHWEIQHHLPPFSSTQAHTMNMYQLPLYSSLGHICCLLLAFFFHTSPSFFLTCLYHPLFHVHTQRQHFSSCRINIMIQISFEKYFNINVWKTSHRKPGYYCHHPWTNTVSRM